MPNQVKRSKKPLTDLIPDVATRRAIDTLDDRIKRFEQAKNTPPQFFSEVAGFGGFLSTTYTLNGPSTSFFKIPFFNVRAKVDGPVRISLTHGPGKGSFLGIINEAGVGVSSADDICMMIYNFLRDGDIIANRIVQQTIESGSTDCGFSLPPEFFAFDDFQCPPGEHSWGFEVATATSLISPTSAQVSFVNCRMSVREIN